MKSPRETAAFEDYAHWYNAFNQGKDYAGEVAYLRRKLLPWQPAPRSWLDIGCGTGEHLAVLKSQGLSTEGVDASPAMIGQARQAHPNIPFHVAKAEDFRLQGDQSVISMLFHVMSYQTTDTAVARIAENVSLHLGMDGVFVFDFWHTAGVLNDPPGVRIRETRLGERALFRIAHPIEDRAQSRVDIRYEFRWDASTGPLVHEEHHSMRHFTRDHLVQLLERAGMNAVACEGWAMDRPLQATDWYGLVCARKQGRSWTS
ncbi:MAG: class I SAM-dependent methyltransferase [Pseudomonadota bacterium]